MAEGDGVVYNSFKHYVMEAVFNLATDSIKAMLVSSYTPDIDTHTAASDAEGQDYATGSNYTSTGAAISGTDVTVVTASDAGKFDGTDLTWTSLGPLSPATPSHALLYDDTVTVPVADALICYFVLGTTATNGGNYTLSWNADGILSIN